MRGINYKLLLALLLVGGLTLLFVNPWINNEASAQQPTVTYATVTGTPHGPLATVNQDQEQINVRAGPSRDYPSVGILEQGETVPALGRSMGGDWVEIAYPVVDGGVAWVYAYYVTISGGDLPVVIPPATPTPKVTPTIDPTLAAQFIIEVGPTRLPTYTQPPSLAIPTYTQVPSAGLTGGLPMGFIIIGLAVVGIFGLIISLFRGR